MTSEQLQNFIVYTIPAAQFVKFVKVGVIKWNEKYGEYMDGEGIVYRKEAQVV